MLSFTVKKATNTKANKLMYKSLGLNNNDTMMGIRFIVCLVAVE